MDDARWTLALDMNLDGAFTISDVGWWLEWLFFVPGDLAIEGMFLLPWIAAFLEFTPADFGGLNSGIFSAVSWIVAVVAYVIISVAFEEGAI